MTPLKPSASFSDHLLDSKWIQKKKQNKTKNKQPIKQNRKCLRTVISRSEGCDGTASTKQPSDVQEQKLLNIT